MRWALLAGLVIACGADRPPPSLDRLRQPTGLHLSHEGRWAYVSNGNWDRGETGGGILVLDLEGLDADLATAPGEGAPTTASPCREADGRLSCRAAHMIVPRAGRGIGSAVGNLVMDRPSGDAGASRLLTIQRAPAAVVWFSVTVGPGGPVLDCGRDFDGGCDAVHTIVQALERPDVTLAANPSRVVLDDQGYRFAYVPHLLGGSLSLLALDGELGPELVDVSSGFFRTDPFENTEFAGGFGVASRPCDAAAPPTASRECTRPVLYTSQRFFPSIRRFGVAPGLDVLVPGTETSVAQINPTSVVSVPFMGDLAFEDPRAGTSLLVVQTSPAALLRIDTSIGEDDDPRDVVRGAVPLCEQPNLLAVHRPEDAEALALVTCFGEGLLAVVGLSSFRVLQTIELGAGANEIAIDAARRRALVANTLDDSISVVSLDHADPRFLTELARIE